MKVGCQKILVQDSFEYTKHMQHKKIIINKAQHKGSNHYQLKTRQRHCNLLRTGANCFSVSIIRVFIVTFFELE